MSISQNFPSSRPSLNLNFARSKKLDPRITFTRTSTATYIDEDGLVKSVATDTPRFDHNPATGESLGLLIEESRTNLITYSEQFNNAAWTNPESGNTITANSTVAPDGSTNADLVSNIGQIVSLVQGQATVPASSQTDYYATIYAKKGTASYFTFNCYYNGNGEDNVAFNFDTGAVTSVPYAGEYIFQNVGNGWYRCGFRMTKDSTGTRTLIVFRFWESGRNLTSGNTYFWGAQLEVGAFPTSYIPTVASTVTRSADNASMTGTNFSSWYNQSEGSVFVQAAPSTNAAYSGFLCSIGSDFNNSIQIYRQSDYQPVVRIRSSSSDVYGSIGFGAIWTTNAARKMILTFKTNSFNSAVSGTVSSDATSGTLPSYSNLIIGSTATGGAQLNGTISQLLYYPVRLSNDQLQTLTK